MVPEFNKILIINSKELLLLIINSGENQQKQCGDKCVKFFKYENIQP